MEYYIYEDNSSLVTSLIPGQVQKAAIAVDRNVAPDLLSAMNNYIYSISEDDLANYLSDGNLHPESSTMMEYLRRHPVQAVVIIVTVTVIIAVVVVTLLTRSSKQRAAMEALHNSQLREALHIAKDANEAK